MAAVTPSPFAERTGSSRTGQGPTLRDPFDVFQIEPAFDLDLEGLGQRHRDLSRALHPDRYVGRPAAERRQALNRAIEVNEAWRTLRDPLERARALLARLGAPVTEDSQPPADPELLMEMMERRESLQQLGRKGDTAGIERLARGARDEERRVLEDLAGSFRRALAGESVPLAALQQRLGELRYYRRFFDEVDALLTS